MTLKIYEDFDVADIAELAAKDAWASTKTASIVPAPCYLGGKAFFTGGGDYSDAAVSEVFVNDSPTGHLYVGFYARWGSISNNSDDCIVQFWVDSDKVMELNTRFNDPSDGSTSGRLVVQKEDGSFGPHPIGAYSSNDAVQSDTWHWVEIVVQPSTGSVTIRVDEVEVLDATGISSNIIGTQAFNKISLGNQRDVDGTWIKELYVETTDQFKEQPIPVTLEAIDLGEAVASASKNSDDAALLIDGNLANQYNSGGSQEVGDWVKIDLGEGNSAAPSLVELSCVAGSNYASDYPRAWVVESSNDDSEWTEEGAGSASVAGALCTTLDAPSTARYWRIKLTDSAGNYWRMNEVRLWNNTATPPGGGGDLDVAGLGAVGILQAMCVSKGLDGTLDFDRSLALLAGHSGGSAMHSLKALGATSGELVGAINELAGTKGLELNGALRAWAASGNF